MTEINQNLNNNQYNLRQNYPSKTSYTLQNQQVRIPSYYVVPENKLTLEEYIQENPLTSMAYEMGIKQLIHHPIGILGTWIGIAMGLDAYSNSCKGDYEKSLVYKAAKLGDNIQNSKAIQNKPIQTILKGLKGIKKQGGKIVDNSAILRAMKNTPTMPELPLVKSQMFNQKQEIVQDFLHITDALKLNAKGSARLNDIGLDKNEIKMLKDVFKTQKISNIPEIDAVNQVLLSRLGLNQKEIQKIHSLGAENATAATKKEILKAMNLTPEKLTLIKDDMYGKYIDDVIKATGKVKNKVRMGEGHYNWLGPATKAFERTIGCDEVYNKLFSITDKTKTTATGRALSKALQVVHRGLTCNSGKPGLLFVVPFLFEIGLNVAKADKDQKVGTAANGFVDNISWVGTFPVALQMMHSLGGIKYAGMSKENVEKMREEIKKFNEKVVENQFATKLEYDTAKKNLMNKIKELKPKKKLGLLTRCAQKLASFLTIDLGNIKSYRNDGFVMNNIRKFFPQGLKNIAGVPMRLALWGILSIGVLGGALTKITTAIFGKPYDAMKDDERKANKKEQIKFTKQDLNRRLYEAQKTKQLNYSKPNNMHTINFNNIASKGYNTIESHNQNVSPIDIDKFAETKENLNNRENSRKIDNYTYFPTEESKQIDTKVIEEINSNPDRYSYIPSQDNKQMGTQATQNMNNSVDKYTYIPSQDNKIIKPIKQNTTDTYHYIPSSDCKISPKKEDDKNKRTYIPSQKGANIQKTFDNSGLQSALDKAQQAEDKALRILAGNFEGM